MQTHCISDQLEFEGFDAHKVVAGFDGGAITSDAGALLLRHADGAIGLFDRVAACFIDHRDRCRRRVGRYRNDPNEAEATGQVGLQSNPSLAEQFEIL
ncbi:hypothetical protein GCM10010869_30220 [Mesorhizobium tianshanense]|uniref:DDE family transposase n=1 Tax=Mesorhizobium tianshanense TaxID=39844 RepID=A0A562MVY9_9HYPH|nr:DDE family transposase [Mesorhizobium tianshanense]GLS37429.1 hypothetical protein GCM10010869_30220 [Mesorhizobium tianshanense]